MTVLAPRILEPKDAYQILAEEYDASPNALIALEQRTMAPLLRDNLAGRTVIDVASGTGRWTLACRERGARAIAVDFCFEMRPSVQADATLLPLPDASADLTICAFALGYAPKCFAELVRITRPGGMLLVSDVHPEALKRGWKRTFRHHGDVIQVADQPYSLADLYAPNLRLSCMIEPHLGPPERVIFDRAGHLDRFEEACREPAIFVARWFVEQAFSPAPHER
jgi:malonyl-CoA O-methyltransferase